jgi:hypothetical protein
MSLLVLLRIRRARSCQATSGTDPSSASDCRHLQSPRNIAADRAPCSTDRIVRRPPHQTPAVARLPEQSGIEAEGLAETVSLLPTLLGSGLGELGDSVLVSRGTTLAPDVGDRFSRDAWLAGQHRTSVSRQQVPSTGAPRFLELSATPDPFSEQPGKFQHVPGRRVHDVVSNQILIPTGFIWHDCSVTRQSNWRPFPATARNQECLQELFLRGSWELYRASFVRKVWFDRPPLKRDDQGDQEQ